MVILDPLGQPMDRHASLDPNAQDMTGLPPVGAIAPRRSLNVHLY